MGPGVELSYAAPSPQPQAHSDASTEGPAETTHMLLEQPLSSPCAVQQSLPFMTQSVQTKRTGSRRSPGSTRDTPASIKRARLDDEGTSSGGDEPTCTLLPEPECGVELCWTLQAVNVSVDPVGQACVFSPHFHTLLRTSSRTSGEHGGPPSAAGFECISPDALMHEQLHVQYTEVQQEACTAGEATLAAHVTALHQQQHMGQEPAAPDTLEHVDVEAEEADVYAEFDPLLFIRSLPPLESVVPKHRALLLPCKTRNCKRQTLVLDLDETLVHSCLEPTADADFKFPVHFNGQEHMIHVRKRPFLHEFMERVAELFEVVVFTASQKIYAEQLLNIIDPDKKYIKYRIFRESCVVVDGNYLKDLSVLGRDLSSTVIVDNSPQAFGFQVDNGIPIESWYEGRDDTELQKLLPFLEGLVNAEDVRPAIRMQYRMHELILTGYSSSSNVAEAMI
mmetsp:Transcript_19192/g.33065  ORF Transcript_19192/g.33065 Transcript_19192/m.33065 type:complete len:450 (-) Transcript_19192:702-2051(-)